MDEQTFRKILRKETISQKQYKSLVEQLARIERKLDFQNNPASLVSVNEKAEIVKRALATGDKKKIKEAARQINGGKG